MTAYRKAETEVDALQQFVLFNALQDDTELLAMLDFAQILHPRKAQAFYEVRGVYSERRNKAEAAKVRVSIAIICDNDFESTVYSALASSLSSHGFVLVRNEGEETHRCQAEVIENEQKSQVTFFTPSVTVTLSGTNGVIFTYNKSIGRVGASDPTVAKKRAYTALGKTLQETFWNDLVRDDTRGQK
jgi:hypothetical protein